MQSSAYGNLMQKGIIDPTKGVRAALQGAASVAGLLITTEARVAELPNKHATASGMPPAQARALDTGAMSALAAH